MFRKKTEPVQEKVTEPRISEPIVTTHDTVVWKDPPPKGGRERFVRIDEAHPVLRAVGAVLKAYDPWLYRYASSSEMLANHPKSVTVQYQDGHRVTYTLGTTKSHRHELLT